jgi:hypothetical protein
VSVGATSGRQFAHERGSDREATVKSQSKTLSMIQARFPGRERSIERAFGENRSFRELCVDYRRCASAVDRWQRSPSNGAASRREEYAELLEDLGLEIQAWLDATESVSTRVKKRIT